MSCHEGRLHKSEDAVVLCLLKIYNSAVIQSAVACSVARLVVMSPIGYFLKLLAAKNSVSGDHTDSYWAIC